MTNSDKLLIKEMLQTPGFLTYKLTGKGLMLKKGKYAPVYINFKSIWANPELMKVLTDRLTSLCLGANGVIGIETGGSPFASVVARELEIPLVLVRKEAKGEMGILAGSIANGGGCIAIVDDVLGGGNSMRDAMTGVKKPNRKIVLISILSYGMDKKIEKKYGISVQSIFQIEDILDVLDSELSKELDPFIKNYQKFLLKLFI